MWKYTPMPDPDELYHWKYISKHKSARNNWVYVYPKEKASQNESRNTDEYQDYIVSDAEKESLEAEFQYLLDLAEYAMKHQKKPKFSNASLPSITDEALGIPNPKTDAPLISLKDFTGPVSRKKNVTGQGKKIYKRNDPTAEALGIPNSWITGYATEENMGKDRPLPKKRK